jgi:hypothetical protein
MQDFADKLNDGEFAVFETSAVTGHNISLAILALLRAGKQ